MKSSATGVIACIISAYEAALGHIAERLRENGMDTAVPDYSCTQDHAYNVNRHDGTSDRVVSVSLIDDNLHLTGESGTVYPVGEDIDGQDNYVIANLETLVEAVDRTVLKEQLKPKTPTSTTHENTKP